MLTLPDGAILRLKGSLYYRLDFTPDMLVPKQEQANPEVVKSRIDEIRVTVARGLEFRAHHTIGRLFGRAEQRRVERGTARNHLAHLLGIKLSDWEVAEPIHPMFANERIHELHRLIKLQHRGQDLLQIPVLQDIVARNPKALSGHVITDKTPPATDWPAASTKFIPLHSPQINNHQITNMTTTNHNYNSNSRPKNYQDRILRSEYQHLRLHFPYGPT